MMEPVMLHNPTDSVFEVMSGGVVYVFQPRQSRIVQGETARQILKNQNTPLIRVEVQPVLPPSDEPVEEPIEETKTQKAVDYSKMSYTELRKIASTMGLFKVGIKGKDLIKLLNEQRKTA